jgi:acetyltransferase-like isoleucine patch superfamily enzyme
VKVKAHASRLIAEPSYRRQFMIFAADRARGYLRGHPGVRLGPGVKLTGPGEYLLARKSIIRQGARIYVGPGAALKLGPGAAIGARTIVNVASGVTIGEGTQISWQCQILDTDFHAIRDEGGESGQMSSPVTIEKNVLVGTGTIVLKGVTIGESAVVGAGSVVARDVAANTVVAGNPARHVTKTAGWT